MMLQRGMHPGGYLSQCESNRKLNEKYIRREEIDRISTWSFDHIRLLIDHEMFGQQDGTPIESGRVTVRAGRRLFH